MSVNKIRLDQAMVARGITGSRSQAGSYIKLGKVKVDNKKVQKPAFQVDDNNQINLEVEVQYVSRSGFKLAYANQKFELDFNNKTVLDVGSSTGGFTEYALLGGALKVIAVDVGSDQMHPKLSNDPRVDLHEKTDIRHFTTDKSVAIDVVVIDVSFISLRDILPHVHSLCGPSAQVVAMLKPQFESGPESRNKGVVKNSKVRRAIITDFETWVKQLFFIRDSVDSQVAGSKGNVERFYQLSIKT